MRTKPYPFEDFMKHASDLMGAKKHRSDDPDDAFFRATIETFKYFKDRYPKNEANDKSTVFMVAVSHLAKHEDDYNTELFGISHDGGILVSEHLARAIHWYFSEIPRQEWGEDYEAMEIIKSKARELIASDKTLKRTDHEDEPPKP